MATATLPQKPVTLTYEPRIANPLARLRRMIRTYIVVEGLAAFLIVVCVWFWFTLGIDGGLYQLFNVDYIRDGSETFRGFLRGVFLTILMVGLVAVIAGKLVYRLIASFKEPALALVLERRFPEILEDRLVTAVELAGPAAGASYGYSQVMIEETTVAAAERVGRLPLARVFNWPRLVGQCALATLLLVSVVAFGVVYTDASATWLKRNLFLQDLHWPRQTMVELLGFPADGTKAVPYGGELRIAARAWKWVVAKPTASEGWRPLQWEDLWPMTGAENPPWELEPPCLAREYYDWLPGTWKVLSPDQVELRVSAAMALTPGPEGQGYLAELGNALLERVSQQMTDGHGGKTRTLNPLIVELLPEDWRELPLPTLGAYIAASPKLTPSQITRLMGLLNRRRVAPSDAGTWLLAGIAPVKPVLLDTFALQQLGQLKEPPVQEIGLDEADLNCLPTVWRGFTPRVIATKLQDFLATKTPAHLGLSMAKKLEQFYTELEARANLSHRGRLRSFRRLDVPDELTIEFEQILTPEERAHMKPKLGKPTVRRSPDANDFAYDFKKVERPTRFRLIAGHTDSPWYQLNVVPLPALRRLARFQEEPGYLYGSNERVKIGPVSVSLEGEESRIDIRTGTRLRFEGVCYKPLRWFRVRAEGQTGESAEPHPAVDSITHEDGEVSFAVALKELGQDDLKLRLEFEDTDGIIGSRKLHIAAVRDRGPEFVHAHFEVVRREMITSQAVIPFSGRIRDEHGLVSLAYEAKIIKLDGAVVHTGRAPFRQFRPLKLSEPRFVTSKDLSFARLNTGFHWWQNWAQSTATGLPFAGPLGGYSPPSVEIPKEHTFEFPLRPGDQPVLTPGDEYLDTSLFKQQMEAANVQALAPPYRLALYLIARDNYVGQGDVGRPVRGQESKSPEAFEFLVVSEEDLLIEAGSREEGLRDRFAATIENLKKARTTLKKIRDDFASLKKEEFRRVTADCQDVGKVIREGRDATEREVTREFRQIYRELVLNRCQAQILERIDRRICRPLEEIVRPGKQFTLAEEAVLSLAARLETEKEKTPGSALLAALQQTDRLLAQLEAILQEMKKLMDFNEALQRLRDIIKAYDTVLKAVEELEKKRQDQELGGEKPKQEPK